MERAAREDKPILLSIGYSACHWCHVMEKESFEDEETARLMNELFINVKVDREERPDLDRLYMNAVQILSGNAGWPLTVFLTPELVPFYGGTYFPPEDRGGMPGFGKVLRSVAAAYRGRKEQINKGTGHLVDALRNASSFRGEANPLSNELIGQAYSSLVQQFDWKHGGFGGAPKFPQVSALGFLLRVAFTEEPGRAREMVEKTLDGMAAGGIRDQLGGGFHRYSVDERWLVPHFEKMLYDNAMLARIYVDAYAATGNEEYAEVARETLRYVLREMTSPGGGFYSSQDADSEGEEGKYYVWSEEEIFSVLGEKDGAMVARFFGVDKVGNFEGHRSVLHRPISTETLARLFDVDPREVVQVIKHGKGALLEEREKRVRPARDEKVIVAWNSLMIGAMARGYQVLGEESFLKAGQKAADFLLTELRNKDGLLHVWAKRRGKVPGFLEDYVLLGEGLLDLWESDFDIRWLREAIALADELIRLFWDDRRQSFRSTGPKHERLIADIPALQDDPVPSGNAAAVHLLLRLGVLTEQRHYAEKAEGVLRSFSNVMEGSPGAVPHLLSGLHRLLSPSTQIVVAGGDDPGEAEAHLAIARKVYLPNAMVVLITAQNAEQLEKLVPLVAGKSARNGKTIAYVCVGQTCLAPATDPRQLEKLLRDVQGGGVKGA